MNKKRKKSIPQKFKSWLEILYYIGTLMSLLFIMAQVFFARRSIVESSEWEKAKLTIENIERFKEKLHGCELFGKTDILLFADRSWPDFSTIEGYEKTDSLRKIYYALFDGDQSKAFDDYLYTIDVMDAFAYPIIMGYANETGSFVSVYREFMWYGNYMMPYAFHNFINTGPHAKLLHRLWRVKSELFFIPRWNLEHLQNNLDQLLCFEGTEVTPASIKQYEKKLRKELKKIQKEIVEFRKISLN